MTAPDPSCQVWTDLRSVDPLELVSELGFRVEGVDPLPLVP